MASKTDRRDVGLALSVVRARACKSQKDVAAALGISRGTVSHRESGSAGMSFDGFMAHLRECGCTLKEFAEELERVEERRAR